MHYFFKLITIYLKILELMTSQNFSSEHNFFKIMAEVQYVSFSWWRYCINILRYFEIQKLLFWEVSLIFWHNVILPDCGGNEFPQTRAPEVVRGGKKRANSQCLIISRLSYSLFNANYSTRELFLRARRGNIYRGAHLAYLHRTKKKRKENEIKISHKQRHSSSSTVIQGVFFVAISMNFLFLNPSQTQ